METGPREAAIDLSVGLMMRLTTFRQRLKSVATAVETLKSDQRAKRRREVRQEIVGQKQCLGGIFSERSSRRASNQNDIRAAESEQRIYTSG
jgi:hypothetical protein